MATLAAGEPAYAGFWRRFWALIIDTIIFYLVVGIVVVPVVFYAGVSTDALEEGHPLVVLAYAGSFVLWWLYYAVMESSSRQATIGKMALSIKVTDMEGQPLGFWHAVARNLAKLVSSMILMIGYLIAAFTKRKQALHDIITDCLVVKRR